MSVYILKTTMDNIKRPMTTLNNILIYIADIRFKILIDKELLEIK